MNTKRNLIALSTFAMLTLSISPHIFAASPLQTTPDKTTRSHQGKAHDHHKSVKETTVTAAEGIQLIVNALKLNIDHIRFFKKPEATDYFAHADNKAWYADVLIVAALNGLDLPADLDPNQLWTKEEFIHQLISAMEKTNKLPMIKIAPVALGDHDELNPDYEGTIQRAIAFGIASLDAEGNLHPKAVLSRSDATKMIGTAMEYIQSHSELPQK
ncbi:MAG: S-layer homology domain-containing protein [Clostridia bacterium]